MSLSTITPLVQIFFSVLGFAYLATSNKATQLQPSYTPTTAKLNIPQDPYTFSHPTELISQEKDGSVVMRFPTNGGEQPPRIPNKTNPYSSPL